MSSEVSRKKVGDTMRHVILFLKSNAGATSIEYAMIAALISVAVIVSIGAVGSALTGVYQTWSNAVGAAVN